MFVWIAFAPSDETGTLNFFLFLIVRTLGLFNLGEHQVKLCLKLFSLLFFHRSLIPALPQLFDYEIANPPTDCRHVAQTHSGN
jgi:hypothetical protein